MRKEKEMLDEAINIQKEIKRKLKDFIDFAYDKGRIIDHVELGKAEEYMKFTIQKLTDMWIRKITEDIFKEKISNVIEEFFNAYNIPLATKKYTADDLIKAIVKSLK